MNRCGIHAVVLPMGFVLGLTLGPASRAGDIPMPTGIECVRDCPGTATPRRGHSHVRGGDAKGMVVEALFGAILGAALAPQPDDEDEARRRQEEAAARAAQKLAEQRAQAIAAQAAYDRMMQSYKQLEGAASVGFKNLSSQGVDFKPLGSDLDAQAAEARVPFDIPAEPAPSPPPGAIHEPTPFFGDTMPITQIRLLIEPANDPRVVDLRKAKTFVVQSVKQPQDRADQGKPAWTGPNVAECRDMQGKLGGFITQQNKFHQTILLANEQVDVWEEANRNALINAAKEGIERFADIYLETLNRRGEAAERLTRSFERNKARMLADGVDVAEVERKIARLRTTAKVGKAAGVITDANDWQTFMKDGMSAVLKQLNASNAEIFEDPLIQRYLTTDLPELQTLLDLSQIAASAGVFGKWVAKQMPMVAWTSFAINQTYNATDWYLSFQRLADAHRINGKVAEAGRSLQNKIDGTRIALKQCS
jgi:hypothetical protein